MIERDQSKLKFRFLTQVEQLLGEGVEPDALFFVDSWSAGTRAAVNRFLRRCGDQPPADYFDGGHQVPEDKNVLYAFEPKKSGSESDSSTEISVDNPPSPAFTAEYSEPDAAIEDKQAELPVEPMRVRDARRLLGVTAANTREQVRAAFREMASAYHPDRFEQRSKSERQHATERMARLNEAYRLLCRNL